MAIKDWVEQLQSAEKEREGFVKQGRDGYRAYKGQTPSEGTILEAYQYNLFWANIGVLRSALYASPPKPSVKRDYDDYMDQPARVASIMMERLLEQDLCTEVGDMDTNIAMAVDDKLIAGMGQIWCRYVPTIDEFEMAEVTDTEGTVIAEAQTLEEITDEQVLTDYVFWEDFFWSPARTWGEVWWVARRVWMTPKEVLEEFGEEAAKDVNYSTQTSQRTTAGELTPMNNHDKKAEIFECWNKKNKTVCFYTRDRDEPLKDEDDPLDIPGFFPCPKPLAANITNGNWLPRSDYKMLERQYNRIDMLSQRIYLLEEAVRVAGVYDKTNNELQQLLSEGALNKMIPVDNWAMLAEKGGLAGSVDWFPLEMVTGSLQVLNGELVEANKQLYELSGISDIMRGTTAPRETLGAQQMKAQYSSTRLQYQQMEVAKFVSAVLKIKASIISQHFQPQNIIKRSNIMLTPDAAYAVEATQLLKDQWAVCYRIQVESDQMAIPDYNAERQGRIEFLTATGQFFSQIMPLVQAEPAAAPFFLEILKWGIAGFKSGATIEGVFDRAIKEMTKKPPQSPKDKPDPAMLKAQADIQANNAKTQADIKNDQMKTQSDIATDQAKTRSDIATDNAKTSADIKQDWEKVNAQIAQIRAKEKASD